MLAVTSSVQPFFSGSSGTCGGCEVLASDTLFTASASETARNNSQTSRPDVYLVFESFEFTSILSTEGSCVTESNNKTLSLPFSYLSLSDSSSSIVQVDAQRAFTSFLGYSDCSFLGLPITTPTTFGTSKLLSGTASSFLKVSASQNSSLLNRAASSSLNEPTSQNVPSSRPTSKTDSNTRIIIAVPIAVGFIIISVLAIVILRRYRKRRTAAVTDTADSADPLDGTQPYLQQKAELEAEERQRNELEARERRFEVGGGNEVHELAAEGERRRMSLLQELRGPEHSQELDVRDDPDEKTK